jgi:hypothetical protein
MKLLYVIFIFANVYAKFLVTLWLAQALKKFWVHLCDQAFAHLKRVLSTPPVMVAPNEKEPLPLYIAATYQVVSIVLVVESSEEGKAHGIQRPVYFFSEVLSPSKQRYPHYQKLVYSVFMTVRKLRHYFAVHPIIVVNEAPLSNILNNPEAIGHVSLWGIKISPWTSCMRKERPSNPKSCQIHR